MQPPLGATASSRAERIRDAWGLPLLSAPLPDLWQRLLLWAGAPAGLILLCLIGLYGSYVLFHLLAELTTVVLGLVTLAVASLSWRFTHNYFLIFVGIALGWSGLIDLIHALAYPGMGVLPGEQATWSTQLWLAARTLQALALAVAPWFVLRPFRVVQLHAALGIYTTGLLWLTFAGELPVTYVPGAGLTPVKTWFEYGIIAVLIIAFWHLRRRRAALDNEQYRTVQAALALTILSEFAFTQYLSVYGPANVVGHLLKIWAYWLVFVGLARATMSRPFAVMAAAAATYDAIPDATLIVDARGKVLRANRAAGELLGQEAAGLEGQDAHALLHDRTVEPGACAVCQLVSQREWTGTVQLPWNQRVLSCSLAPYARAGTTDAHVEVFHDVTAAARLAREREGLVDRLGERIKELRCLAEVSAVTDRPDATPAHLLAETVRLLPGGFQDPGAIAASATGSYGTFGDAGPSPHQLERQIRVANRVVATLTVASTDADKTAEDAFLAEESALLDMVVSRLSLALERLEGLAKLRLQTHLYETLSATNRAIVHAKEESELLQGLFVAMQGRSGMRTVVVVQLARDDAPASILFASSSEPPTPDVLDEWLAPDGLIGQAMSQLVAGQVVSVAACANAPVHALLPLLRSGTLRHVVVLAAEVGEQLGAEHLRLLDETADDMAYALTGLDTEQERLEATERQHLAEARLARVFAAAPVPIMLIHQPTQTITALNEALLQWLGYRAEELADLDAWYHAVYPNEADQALVQQHWTMAVAESTRQQTAVSSPELSLRRKDGQLVRAVGTTVSLGDQSIVVWQDWTEVRRGETALRESEQRFRGMIEQAVTGIYVRQGERFVYVNDALCRLMGYSRAQLLSLPVGELLVEDDALRDERLQSYRSLAATGQQVVVTVEARHANGGRRYLALRVGPIDWEGTPAAIGLVEDVTEREQTRAQLARYVNQLERSMRGTLEVVARMVDQRDPYTAGHERRVGLLAKAIGQELGWDTVRCEGLELMGMVHDVGKIGMPAEILTKPGRLTPVEYALIQQHSSIGHDILLHIDFPMPIAEVVWQHHERLDGSGYPRGLRGEQILPEARVLAVADVLESMASHRPYRAALGIDAALDELEQGSGSRYDAEVVAAVGRMVRRPGFVLPA